MKKAPLFSLVFAAAVLAATTLVRATPPTQAGAQESGSGQQPAATAGDQPGAALLHRMCNECHDSARIVEKRRGKDEWQSLILKMIEEGAQGEPKEFETLFAYLCLNHGEVHINNAGALEITMTLGLTRKDADAIVAYRTANGTFADLDALRKVPGIDLKTLEQHKDALAF